MARLLDLPNELILMIFDNLEQGYLMITVSQVCRRLNGIIHDRKYSKLEYFRRLWGWFPRLEDVPMVRRWDRYNGSKHIRMAALVRDLEVCRGFRSSNKHMLNSSTINHNHKPYWWWYHFGCMHILKKSTALVLFDVDVIKIWDVAGQPEPVFRSSISTPDQLGEQLLMDSIDDTSFVACCTGEVEYDNYIRGWRIRESSCEAFLYVDCSRVYGLAARADMIAIGDVKSLLFVDPRTTRTVHSHSGDHKRYEDFAMSENNLYAIAHPIKDADYDEVRDDEVIVFDIRMWRTVLSRPTGTLTHVRLKAEGNIVYTWDSISTVRLLDASRNLEEFHCISIPKVERMIADSGTLICACDWNYYSKLRFVNPSKPRCIMNEINCEGYIIGMSYENVLAVLTRAPDMFRQGPPKVAIYWNQPTANNEDDNDYESEDEAG